MPLNRDFVGRTTKSDQPFEVTRGDIRRFALAMGDAHPVYLDQEAARARGHADVVAPPTFLISMGGGGEAFLSDPALGLNFAMLVHGEQGFELHRPVCAGDLLDTETRIDRIVDAGRHELLTLITEVSCSGEPVARITNTIVSRGSAAGES